MFTQLMWYCVRLMSEFQARIVSHIALPAQNQKSIEPSDAGSRQLSAGQLSAI